jgi:hypothetical protein
MLDRRALTYEAAQEAADARDAAGVQQDVPICAYDLAHALNASVRFVDVNMEGIYEADLRLEYFSRHIGR